MALGSFLKSARKAAGLTQGELAKKASISINTVINYENNKRTPTLEIAGKLAKALCIDVQDIIEEASAPVSVEGVFEGENISVYLPAPPVEETPLQALTVAFDKLNDDGQHVAVQRVEELTEIPKYRK